MNKLRLFFFLSIMTSSVIVQAQDISYGFKAGLNFNRLISDAETADDQTELESFSGKTGFHVGMAFTWSLSDLMGIRSELVFSQKGYKRRYKGASFYNFTADNGTEVSFTNGERNMFFSVANSYIDIPIVGYAKIFKWLEVHAGANVGFLVSSTAIGNMEFKGTGNNGVDFTIEYDLDYRYGSDKVGAFDEAGTPQIINIDGDAFSLPNSVGAYYEYPEKDKNYHKFLDFGLVGGFSFFLNRGLYVGMRANYGLMDITRNSTDFSYQKQNDDGSFIQTKDKDKNFSIQTSVGFSF